LVERGFAFDATHRAETSRSTFDFECRIPRREHRLESVAIALPGAHQAANAAVALAAIEELRTQGWDLDEAAIRRGLAEVRWPARIEKIADRPTVVLDSAHNVASVEALLGTLAESFPAQRRILVFATTRDKDAHGMLRLLLPQFDTVFLTRYQINPRGVPVEELGQIAEELRACHCQIFPLSADAWQAARSQAEPDDLIVITGSFFIAAELGGKIRGEN
jgi:dihydrofolate synthase/folylpolyglutamate synthase